VPPAAPNEARELAAVIWRFAELGAITLSEEDEDVPDAAARAAVQNQESRRGTRRGKQSSCPTVRESRYDWRRDFHPRDRVARRA
jgi:hypothetical protein